MRKFIFAFLLMMAFALPVQAAEMVTIENVTKEEVYNRLLENGMRQGCTIQESTEHSLILRSDKTDMNFVITWGSNAYIQHVFNIIQSNQNVLVSYEIRVVNGNQVNPMSKEAIPYYFKTNQEYAEQALSNTISSLTALKGDYNGIYRYGFTDKQKKEKDYIEIIKILPNGPSDKIGLKVGDKITKINSIEVKKRDFGKICVNRE